MPPPQRSGRHAEARWTPGSLSRLGGCARITLSRNVATKYMYCTFEELFPNTQSAGTGRKSLQWLYRLKGSASTLQNLFTKQPLITLKVGSKYVHVHESWVYAKDASGIYLQSPHRVSIALSAYTISLIPIPSRTHRYASPPQSSLSPFPYSRIRTPR